MDLWFLRYVYSPNRIHNDLGFLIFFSFVEICKIMAKIYSEIWFSRTSVQDFDYLPLITS